MLCDYCGRNFQEGDTWISKIYLGYQHNYHPGCYCIESNLPETYIPRLYRILRVVDKGNFYKRTPGGYIKTKVDHDRVSKEIEKFNRTLDKIGVKPLEELKKPEFPWGEEKPPWFR